MGFLNGVEIPVLALVEGKNWSVVVAIGKTEKFYEKCGSITNILMKMLKDE